MITDRKLSDRRVVDPALRASLVVEAALAAALDAPTAVRTVLGTAAVVAVVGTMVRGRSRGRIDATVIGVAGALAVAVLLGLLLNLFPVGLTRVSWAVGAGVLGLAAVAWGARSTPTEDWSSPVSGTTLLRHAPWTLAAAGVSVVAVIVAVHATDIADRAPVQLSLASKSAQLVAVRVTGAHTTGTYRIVVMRGTTELTRSEAFRVGAGQHVDYRFTPTQDRVTVDLRKVGASTTSRSLVVDVSSAAQR